VNSEIIRCLIGAVVALVSSGFAALPVQADDINPAAFEKQPCVYARNQDHLATTWPASRPDPRLMPLQRLFYSTAATYYLECASRRSTPPQLRLGARVRAVEIYDAIGYTKGEYAILADIAHDRSVPAPSRERARDDYFRICHTVLAGHDDDDIRTYCDRPFDSYAEGAGALHDQLTRPTSVAHHDQSKKQQIVAQQISRCAKPDLDAAVIGVAATPEFPDIDRSISGTAQVKVELGSDGGILNASIYQSSGNVDLDEAALTAVRATSFSPAIRNCVAIASSYLFISDFQSR
jgi:TonB family protein